MAKDSKETCKNCKWWNPYNEYQTTGKCRREPPKFAMFNGGGEISGTFGKNPYPADDHDTHQIRLHSNQGYDSDQGRWPITDQEDWCGEFKKKAENGIEKAIERLEEEETP